MFRKFIIFLRLYWLRLIFTSLCLAMLLWMFQFMVVANENYQQLESFSRRNLSAQMGQSLIMFIFVALIQMPMMFVMYYFIYSGAMFSVGNNKMKAAKVNTKWDEVIGMESAKKEAWEIVKLLKDRHLVQSIGGKIIKGVMMIGPPGCGKTYLAKAIATECGFPLIPAVGSDFIGMFVGQGVSQMKSLFKQARAQASLHGGCIIFIDEIDSFARPRQADMGFGGTMSNTATINQFLTELDGLRQRENNIVVFAATNVREDELDSAVMRAGRFDRKIYVTRPNLKERKLLFDFYLSKVKTEVTLDANHLAKKTLWFSPADIENMIREASLIANRYSRSSINMKDLSESYDRVVFGMKSNIIVTDKEKYWTAYHEAGHAIIGYMIHPTDDVIKATIIPRKGNLGMISLRPQEELYSSSKIELMADIKVSVAAYVAERLKFGTTTQGVGGGPGSDFYSAMTTSSIMVKRLGMGKSGLLGDFGYFEDGGWNKNVSISEKYKEIIDSDIQEILNECVKDVEKILTQNKELFEYFAEELYKKEELEYDEIEAIFQKFGIKPASRADIV